MNHLNLQTTVAPTVNITKFPLDATVQYDLDETTTWVSDLYSELEELTDREDSDYDKGNLTVSFDIKRKSEKPFGDHILIKGHLETSFFLPCVRCLKLTPQKVSEDFSCSFLHKSMENTPEYEEADDIFTENEEYDLYFHDKGQVDLAEAIHEQLYIHVDAFALHDAKCKGLCPECGQNLNEDSCKHVAS
jgi:uncharacterized metal-binding protein YceD (DUF177 family)